MTPQEYIQEELNELKNFQPRKVAEETIADEIFRLLMSKKFRKYSTNPEYIVHIRAAIKSSIEKNEPIKLTLVFGGYKLWRLEESPEADWAELFCLIYYAHWLLPIASLYKPGICLDFYSDDVILEIMDNVPKQDTESYIKTFRYLLDFMKLYIPENLQFTLNRVGDQYKNYDAFKSELEESINNVKTELGGLPKLTEEQIGLVMLNVKLKSGQTDDPTWKEKVFLIHEGYARVSKRRPYYRTPDKIFIVTRPAKDSLAVGTTKSSIAKFWVGVGVLKHENDNYREYILSPKQLDAKTFIKTNITINGLEGKNFKSIRILE